jgi:HlyD family secretion protein
MKKAKTIEKEVAPDTLDDLIEGPVSIPENKRRISKRTLWIIGGALLIVAVIVISSITNAKKAASTQTYQTSILERGNLVAVVGATGTVRANQTTSLYWQTTGRIEKINYALGDLVDEGDQLANLAQSSLPQAVISASAQLFNAQQALEQVERSTASRSDAALALAQAQRAYNSALGNYWNGTNTQGSDNQITLTRAQLQIAENHIDDLQDLYDKMDELKDTDTKKAETLQYLAQARIDRDNIKKLLDYYEALPDTLDKQTLEAQLDVAKDNLADAQREYNRLKDGPDPAEVAAAQANVAALQATIDMAYLTAPFSGTVTEVNSMIGDLVNAGTVTFRIDDLSKMMVDIEVPEVDINSINAGQSATLTFDAIPNKEYTAKVTEVARVGEFIGGVAQFKVTLQLLDADEQVLPGMTAAVNIAVENKQDVLLVPNRAIRLVNDQYVIYIIRDGVKMMIPIEIGSTSDSSSEILSGDVHEGDEVILNPSSSLIDLMQSQQGMPGMGG